MSGTLGLPLMAPEQAEKMLDEVIYERVLACIDLEALFHVELDLWVAVHEAKLADDMQARQIAKVMVERALARVPEDPRRYPEFAPFGMHCDDCEDEVRESAKRRRKR